MSGPERVIFGFHTVLARLRADPKSVLEVFLDEARKDARAKDFAAAVQQAAAQLVLQQLDLAADGGLRHVQALRRAGEAALLGHGPEHLQLAHIHWHDPLS